MHAAWLLPFGISPLAVRHGSLYLDDKLPQDDRYGKRFFSDFGCDEVQLKQAIDEVRGSSKDPWRIQHNLISFTVIIFFVQL